MTDPDLTCERAAAQVLNRTREEHLMVAHLRATLPVMREIAAAISATDDPPASKPRRRNRTIRVAYDDEGAAIGTEDVEPTTVGANAEGTWS
jgi:hypothetical protein